MEKFLSISTSSQNTVLASTKDVMTVITGGGSPTATTTVIVYNTGKTVILNHTAQVGFNVRIALQKAITESLVSPWTQVVHTFESPVAITGFDIA